MDIRAEGDSYLAYEGDMLIGELKYLPGPGCLTILTLGVDKEHQRSGVATALLAKLNDDHPTEKIDPGDTTEPGRSFCRHLLGTQPRAQAALSPSYQEKWVGY